MNSVNKQHKTSPDIQKQAIDEWFTGLIEDIKIDHFLMHEKIASKEKSDFYNALISKDEGKVLSDTRRISTQYFIQRLVFDYLNEIKKTNKRPLKLALGISDSKILVWSEIEDNDEGMEDVLLLSEAKVNSSYSKNGFYIHSTIIEKSDNIPVPPHYQTILG